MEPEGPLPC